MSGITSRWRSCDILDRDDTVLATVPGRVWRLGRSNTTPSGQRYDYSGAVHIDASDALVNHQNRILKVGGENYRVIDASPWTTLGYIDLALVQGRADG